MIEDKKTFVIRFADLPVSDSGVKAKRLRDEVLDCSPEVQATIQREDAANQDFGSVLVLVLGTPAIIAVAKGIANFLCRERATIVIEEDGKVISAEMTGKDAAKIAAEIVEIMSHSKIAR